MQPLIYIILFVSILISGMSVTIFKVKPNNLKLILSFSGAYLFALSVLHLIPDIYSTGDRSIGIYILAGFFLQILLEFFSEGIEHGHIHIHKHEHSVSFPTGIMLGLSIHSF